MPELRIPARKLAAAAIVAAGACLLVAILILGIDDKSATGRDFIQYWALEQQLAHGANPYDPDAILHIERAVGMDKPGVLISLSPPVGLVYALPLGWVSAKTGLVLWMLLLLACTAVSVWILWLLHGRPESRWHVIGLGFPPVLWCLIAGQLGIFFLLEICLFLYFIRRRPWLAGAALALCALKPHLFLPLALVLLLWSITRKQIGVLVGLAAGLAVSCGLTLWADPRVWSQYAQMLHSVHIMDQFLPTVSVGLRFLVDRRARWIEFVPEGCACLWAAWYFLARRVRWEWDRDGLLVLLVSAACTPYSWYSDQVMLFPAILAGLYAAEKSTRVLALFGVIAAAGLVGFLVQIPMTSAYYIWTAPAWLAWYLYALRSGGAAELAQSDGALVVSSGV
jgi:Glycosyltransferase family 87